jgi:hypothetical protein
MTNKPKTDYEGPNPLKPRPTRQEIVDEAIARLSEDLAELNAVPSSTLPLEGELARALQQCEIIFLDYSALHLAKRTRAGEEKAQTNADHAAMCREALATRTAPPLSPDKLVELRTYVTADCNRYINGECQTRRCLERGGWNEGPPDYATATCEEHEIATALLALADERNGR